MTFYQEEAAAQYKRLQAAIDDCCDRPESTARRMIEMEDDRDWWRSRAQLLATQYEQATKGNAHVPPTL